MQSLQQKTEIQIATSISSNLYEEDCESKVLIIVTGGTFIMAPTPNGLVVQPGYLSKRMSSDIDFHHPALPSYDILEWENPIDSSCIQPSDWVLLCTQISSNYHQYDGFIILHGTDTMSYTASALSFMLENLSKPVVLTGAQIPIGEVFNDAKNNLIASLCVAGQCQICEVCLMFNNKLLRGNRSTKFDAWHQDAFCSPNMPPLGIFGIELEMEEEYFVAAPKRRFQVHSKLFNEIVVLWLVPGFNCDLLKAVVESEEEIAIVLSFYGIGRGPAAMKLYRLLAAAKKKFKKEIVIMSQCSKGHVDIHGDAMKGSDPIHKSDKKQTVNAEEEEMKKGDDAMKNEKGKEEEREDAIQSLYELNAMNAHDMTVEAVVTKLSFLMGQGLRGDKLKQQFECNLRGEMTPLAEVAAKVVKLQKRHYQ